MVDTNPLDSAQLSKKSHQASSPCLKALYHIAEASLPISISGKKSCFILHAVHVVDTQKMAVVGWFHESRENYHGTMPIIGGRKMGVIWPLGWLKKELPPNKWAWGVPERYYDRLISWPENNLAQNHTHSKVSKYESIAYFLIHKKNLNPPCIHHKCSNDDQNYAFFDHIKLILTSAPG